MKGVGNVNIHYKHLDHENRIGGKPMRSEGGGCWRLRLLEEGVGFFAGSES